MMTINRLLAVLLTAFLFACQNGSEQKDKDEDAGEKHDTVRTHEEHHDHSNAISLDNGKKWIANPETTEGIKNMVSLTDSFPAKAKPEDYQSLKVKLETEFNQILQKCTMTGEAHNQLHNYLLPMKEMIEKLDSQDIAKSGNALDNLRKHLSEYGNYFQ